MNNCADMKIVDGKRVFITHETLREQERELKRSDRAKRESMRKDRDGFLHSELCKIAEQWILRKYRLAIAEPNCIVTMEQPDAIGWRGESSILVEAKTSRSDFLADRKKIFRIHENMGMGNYRYYICKPEIISVDDLPPLWGLLHVLPNGRVKVIRESRHFSEINHSAERSLLTACLYIGKPLKIKSIVNKSVHTWKGELNG